MQINFKSLPAGGTGNAEEFHGAILSQRGKLAIRILGASLKACLGAVAHPMPRQKS